MKSFLIGCGVVAAVSAISVDDKAWQWIDVVGPPGDFESHGLRMLGLSGDCKGDVVAAESR